MISSLPFVNTERLAACSRLTSSPVIQAPTIKCPPSHLAVEVRPPLEKSNVHKTQKNWDRRDYMRPNTTILIVMILYIVFITRHSILLLTLFSLGHLLGSLSSTHYTLVIMFTWGRGLYHNLHIIIIHNMFSIRYCINISFNFHMKYYTHRSFLVPRDP